MKRLIIILLIGYIVPNSFGQIYIKPSVGYTFSSHPSVFQSVMIIENHKTVYKLEHKFGEGIHVGLDLGFSITDNFFAELNTKKSIYTKYKISTEQPNLQLSNNFSLTGYFGDINYESSIYQITPLFGYQIHKNKFSSYFKFGPNLMKSTINNTLKYIGRELGDSGFSPLNIVKKYEYKGEFHIGLQANLGFCYSIKQNLQIILDFVTVYNNYEITKAKIVYYEIDGVNHLDQFEDTNIEVDEDDLKLNHSHYGINLGIRYVFDRNI